MMRPRRPALSLLAICLAACTAEPAEAPPTAGAGPASDTAESFQGRLFERNVVFLTARPDSNLLVPWLVTARTLPGGVRREVRGLLGRADTFEPFFAERWETVASREPWRVLPRGRMRLVVGDDDALEQIVFDEGPRQLAVQLGGLIVEWSGQRGETFRVLDGTLDLSNARVPGVVLDMSRGRTAREGVGGDWAILVAGDTLQVLLHAPDPVPPGGGGVFRGWARSGADEVHWPRVSLEWTETRAFEPARRDVPTRWTIEAPGGELGGELVVRGSHIEAGTGEGPQLPVDALFQVQGTLRIGEAEHPVLGLLRHIQP